MKITVKAIVLKEDFKDILKSFYICDGEIFKFELYIEICLINAYM